MRICMVGAGYVGLVSAACFAKFGFTVRCVDRDASRVARLTRGEIPIYEPGLEPLVRENVAAGRLHFGTDLRDAVADADVVFIAVGTPSRRGDGHADLSYVEAAAREIAAAVPAGRTTVLVTKSTVPVGTGRRLEQLVREARPDVAIEVVSNPEFLREGSAIEDFMRPDRVVIGASSEHARAVMQQLYRPLFLLETPMLMTTLETAELTKYAANAFLATKITFINEIADLCERVGADVQDVARGMGLDGRIGRKFLHAGPGYGGSCFPKDTRALAVTARQVEANLSIVETVVSVNERRKERLVERVAAACGDLAGATIAVLGVAFKPNTDDMREAPSLTLVPALQARGATVRAFDPAAMKEAAALLPDVAWARDPYEAVAGADALVLLTEWNEFRALDLQRVREALRRPLVVDFRNVYPPHEMREAGLEYHSVGRPPIGAADQRTAAPTGATGATSRQPAR